MSRSAKKILPRTLDVPPAPTEGLLLGTLAEIAADGVPYVALPGEAKPVAALAAVRVAPADRDRLIGAEVLLHRAARGLVIVGFVRETLFSPEPQASEATAELAGPIGALDARIDGQAIKLTAEREIVLECGKSTLLLRADGTIVLKGVKITSRASRSNKLRGASVNIN